MTVLIANALELAALMLLLQSAWTDFTEGLLPDVNTVIAFVLAFAGQALRGEATLALAGALTGFCLLKGVQIFYRRVRGKDGLGSGDVKLMFPLGALVGPMGIVAVIGIASLLALLFYLPPRELRSFFLPFGPFLVAATLVVKPFILTPGFLSALLEAIPC